MYTIHKNKYGFYSVIPIPEDKELENYYSKKYYQNGITTYKNQYSEEEKKYYRNKIVQKHAIFQSRIKKNKPILVDIGCGEGFGLDYFNKIGYQILGIDYSSAGLENHHSYLKDKLITGKFEVAIDKAKQIYKKIDVIWLDNVLEHVTDPLHILKECYNWASEKAILMIEVPNDFSVLQEKLFKEGYVDKQYWVAYPDHLSFFNQNGLKKIALEAGWNNFDLIADYPIEFDLFESQRNYVKNNTLGKESHKQRIAIENFLHSISIEKTNDYYRSLAELGLGRTIVGFFIK